MAATDPDPDDFPDMGITLMTLRKPTELKKVIDSIPKPVKAVPKNGLPLWYKLGLECKLPVPTIPKGKVIFSRGKIGEDVRKSDRGYTPTFDLSDPNCNYVSYEYDPMHDPHLGQYFAQKPARRRMMQLGFVTKDGRAVCSLKEFNQYRKFLYNIFMDRIHMEMQKLDERARDDLTLHRVALDVSRRLLAFQKAERARAQLAKVAAEFGNVWEEKKRMAAEREKKVQERMRRLAEYNEKQRKERAARAFEKESRIKQRVQAAAELELRRKIMMVRQWRVNERKRLNRVRAERERKLQQKENEENRKWTERIEAQNAKIQEESFLLKIYSDDMKAGANRRIRMAKIRAYEADLQLQRIRMANLKVMRGEVDKEKKIVKKMGHELEKVSRGAKGMDSSKAKVVAEEAMGKASSVSGDRFTTLAQARLLMDMQTTKPNPPLKLLDEILEACVMECARRRVNNLLRVLATSIRHHAGNKFIHHRDHIDHKHKKLKPRWAQYITDEFSKGLVEKHSSISFGDVITYAPKEFTEVDLQSVKFRKPTPVPSKTKLVEVTFSERLPDLPDAVTNPSFFPEREKLLETVNVAGRLLSRSVNKRVDSSMDLVTGKITLPVMRHSMEWGEAVESLAIALVENRINGDCSEVRQVAEFLSHRILMSLISEMKEVKARAKRRSSLDQEKTQDFYIPGRVV